MSRFTLDNLIVECTKTKWRTKLPVKAKKEALSNIWNALMEWTEDCFNRGKGVKFPNFGQLAIEDKTNGSCMTQTFGPVFLLNESYAKSNGLKYAKNMIPPVIQTTEELNFTLIAIKYTKTLTKDVVFTGVRDLFQRLTQVMSSGAHVEMKFGNVGTLNVKNNKVHFVFNPRWVLNKKIFKVEAPAAAPETNRDDESIGSQSTVDNVRESKFDDYDEEELELDSAAAMMQDESKYDDHEQDLDLDLDQSESKVRDEISDLKLSERGIGGGSLVPHASLLRDLAESKKSDPLYSNSNRSSDLFSQRPNNSLNFASNVIDMRLPKILVEGGKQQAEAYDSAVERQLLEIEKLVEKETQQTQYLTKLNKAEIRKNQENGLKKADEQKQLQKYILKQMKEREERRQQSVAEEKELDLKRHIRKVHSTTRNKETYYADDDKSYDTEFRSYLQNQMQSRNKQERAKKLLAITEEQQLLDSVAQEWQESEVREVKLRKAMKKALTDAWEKDNKIKYMLKEKLRIANKADYSDTSSDQTLPTSPIYTKRSNQSESIGYDSRC